MISVHHILISDHLGSTRWSQTYAGIWRQVRRMSWGQLSTTYPLKKNATCLILFTQKYVISVISYLGVKSWDLQVCDRASTITHVDREKKNSAYYNNKMFYFFLG